MPREATVSICEFCGIYMNENRTLVELHENNVHLREITKKRIREVVHLIASSGKPPGEDKAVWAKIRSGYQPHVIKVAIEYWRRTIAPNWHANNDGTNSK